MDMEKIQKAMGHIGIGLNILVELLEGISDENHPLYWIETDIHRSLFRLSGLYIEQGKKNEKP